MYSMQNAVDAVNNPHEENRLINIPNVYACVIHLNLYKMNYL